MILWLLYGMIGSGVYVPPLPPGPLPDITGNIDYYRQWLDDNVVILSTSPLPTPIGVTPLSEDLDYFRSYLCDI
jgi:hypothetical protein